MTEYEQKLKIEREKKALIKDRLKNILVKMGYTPTTTREDMFYFAQADGTKDQEHIYLNANSYGHKDKINVFGVFPRDNNNDYISPSEDKGYKEINISINKTDEQIIKDIERRFKPNYLNALKEVCERVNKSNNKKKQRENLINEIANILNVKSYTPNYKNDYPSINEYNNGESVNIKTDYNAQELNFNLRLNKEMGLKLVQFLKQNKVLEVKK